MTAFGEVTELTPDEAIEIIQTGNHPDAGLGSAEVDAALIQAIRTGLVRVVRAENGRLVFTRTAKP